MGRKLYIALTLAVVLLLGAAVGAYAWDSSRSDEIAEGVDIGGVDVGGLTAHEAEALVTEELIDPLDRDLVVTYDGVKYKLSAEKLAVRADIHGMVDRALDASQEGGLPTRLVRYATGGEVDESIEPEVLYDKGEVAAIVTKIAGEINREPVHSVAGFRQIVSSLRHGDAMAVFIYIPEIDQKNIRTLRLDPR